MVFNSIDFLTFFPIVLFVYFMLPAKIRHIWLLVCSYYFYMCWNPLYSILLLLVTISTYLGANGIEKVRAKQEMCGSNIQKCSKWIMIGTIAVNLGILTYFKYTNFFIDIFNKFLRKMSIEILPAYDIILPIGISFYMFTSIGYLIDVYKKKCEPEKNLLKYALFVSFFPMILSGPIERSGNLLKQIQSKHKANVWDYERVTSGLITMIWGFFLKLVITDRIAVLADYIFKEYERYGMVGLSIGAIAYGIQIYCDFNSYSTIALGAAKVLGFELLQNFDTPYFSKSVTEFWRRWHISLSSWFRDYIYIPLGGNRCGKSRQYLNILITFSISGLWHGANWTFIFWGFLHGVYQIIEKELKPWIRKINVKLHTKTESFGYKFTKGIITFVLVDFAWIFFRADSMKYAVHYIERMIKYRDWWSLFNKSIYQMGLDVTEIHILSVSLLLVLAVELMQYFKRKTFAEFMAEQWIVFRWISLIVILVVCIVFGYYGPGFDSAQFIYFQF